MKEQIWALLLGGIGVAFLLDRWAGQWGRRLWGTGQEFQLVLQGLWGLMVAGAPQQPALPAPDLPAALPVRARLPQEPKS